MDRYLVANPRKVSGNGWGPGGVGMAEWQYVPIADILDKVGLKPNAKAMLFGSGVDGKVPNTESDTGRPIPIAEALARGNEIGLACKMNGMPLPADHGARVRALVPGWCGGASTKWLTEIKAASHDFRVRLDPTDHTMIGPDPPPPVAAPGDEFRFVRPDRLLGQPVTWQPGRSTLTVPLVMAQQPSIPPNCPLARGQMPVLKAGPQRMRGYAWAPQSGVRRVDVRVDGGRGFEARILDPQINRYSWVRFDFPISPLGGDVTTRTRVTDRLGNTQPSRVPFNKGGYDFEAIPVFRMRVA